MICESEQLSKNQATHVVVAITYGREAFCVFSYRRQLLQMKRAEKVMDYVSHFTDDLISGSNRLESDKELDLKCTFYSDLLRL